MPQSNERIEVVGFKELKATFLSMYNGVRQTGGDWVATQGRAVVIKGMERSSKFLAGQVKSAALGAGWSSSLINRAVFSDADPNHAADNNEYSALVGVRTGAPPRLDSAIFKQWRSRDSVRGDKRRLLTKRKTLNKFLRSR